MRLLKKVLRFLVVLVVLALTGGWIITTYYGDTIIQRVTQALNSRLRTEVTVGQIDLTLWHQFPNAALRFQDVFIPVPESTDTLLSVKELYLQVNLWSLWNEEYTIDGLSLKEGVLYADRDQWGRPNYLIWKETNSTEIDHEFKLDLSKVELESMHIRYDDAQSEVYVEGKQVSAVVSGAFSTDSYILKSKGKAQMDQARFGATEFPDHLPTEWNLELEVAGDTIAISKAALSIDRLPFSGNGGYRPDFIDLYITGDDLSLEHLLERLPKGVADQYAQFNATGKFHFRAHIMGNPQSTPRIYADFHLNNGTLSDPKSEQTLNRLEIEGRYDNGAGNNKAAIIELSEFSGVAQNSTFSGSFSMTGFTSPLIQAKLKAELDLEQISAFLPPALNDELSGSATLDVFFENRFYNLDEIDERDLLYAKMNGTLNLENVRLVSKAFAYPIEQVSGRFSFTNRDLQIEYCRGIVAQSDFSIKGYFRNTLAYALIPGEPVSLEASFSAEQLLLDELISNSGEESDYALELSPRVSYDLKLDVKKLVFERFSAENVQGRVVQKAGVLHAKPIKFKAVDGTFDGQMSIDGRNPKELEMTVRATLNDLDVRRLFYEFNNFGQSTLVSENILGRADATVHFKSFWTPELSTDLDKLYTLAQVEIRNGELIKFEPLTALADYVEVEELERIKFKTLSNRIEISNRKISVPDMQISSSALDFAGSGTHGFDNEIDYRVRMQLSDVLFKKQQKENPELDEHYVFEDQKAGPLLFLHMTGNVYNPIIEYDSQSARKNVVQEFKNEGKEFKEALKQEFNPDTTIDRTEEEPDFVIEWNEEEPDTSRSPNFYDF